MKFFSRKGASEATMPARITNEEADVNDEKDCTSVWMLDLMSGQWIPLSCGILGMSVASAMNLLFPRMMGKAIDVATGRPPPLNLSSKGFFAVVISSFVTGAIASFVRVYSLGLVAERVALRLRQDLYQSLLYQKYAFYQERKVGELVTRLSDDCQVTANALVDVLASGFRSLNSAIGGSAMLFSISPKLTLVSLSILPLVGSTAMIFSKFSSKLAKKHQDELAHMTGIAEEKLNNILTVKLYTAETYEEKVFRGKNRQVLKTALKAKAAQGLFMSGLSISVNLSLYSVLYFGGSLVARKEMTIGALTSFALYSGFMGLGFSKLASCVGDFRRVRQSSQSLLKLLKSLPSSIEAQGNEKVPSIQGHVAFRNVSFYYPSRPELMVLKNISLEINPGEIVAVVSKSGSGKSTLASLMTKLIEPVSGGVYLDGKNISSLDTIWLRRQIGVVIQDPSLFAGSIADNITYGSDAVDVERILEVSKAAHVHEFASELVQQYDTFVGAKGSTFSGGQKQRIAIARALYKQAKILIFDEATSFLDNQSENIVREALETASQDRSVFIIAHRIHTIKQASRILVLDQGEIVETGKYGELNIEGTRFYELVHRRADA
uniref:ATPbinding Cassette (ABC) Superfamily putative n=1 Tax=Albugo laibachii Nc14 TaxID=890382 RepID=F0WVG3_9STRA|nr:ATPbinding Cassette (ABC) Superfamily putative [Albugo laibachii Nc14]|eukprot:CCA25404.1 ATPbinding Cassette (ABC) Superfamily putative [Albugo laibachii Nc14]